MKITQISVFLENKKGRIYDAIRLLGENGIDIKTLTIAENENFGVLRMVTDLPEKALDILKTHQFMASITEIVAVEVGDHPGGLALVLKVLDENKINIEYMYAFVEKCADKAILIFRFDDLDKAIAVLTNSGIRVVGKKDIVDL